MEHREAEDWRIAVEVAKFAPSTGMVPMRCATALAVNAELVMLREWVEDLKRERLVLQKISARRAGALERAGLHADCTMDEAQAVGARLAGLGA
jgi:hypothetical protein